MPLHVFYQLRSRKTLTFFFFQMSCLNIPQSAQSPAFLSFSYSVAWRSPQLLRQLVALGGEACGTSGKQIPSEIPRGLIRLHVLGWWGSRACCLAAQVRPVKLGALVLWAYSLWPNPRGMLEPMSGSFERSGQACACRVACCWSLSFCDAHSVPDSLSS